MDKDRIKGKVNEVAGRSKRQAGEWTGDTRAQAEGGVKELKGQVQNAWGKAKDAARDAGESPKAPHPEHPHSDRH
ncbi:MAG: CsbD family protein [Terracidiphilus sp.]